MMSRNIENSYGHFLKNPKILLLGDYSCCVYFQGKLITKQFPSNIVVESPSFLERILGDNCGHIHYDMGHSSIFMVLIDALTRLSHVCLLSSRNIAFTILFAQIIRL